MGSAASLPAENSLDNTVSTEKSCTHGHKDSDRLIDVLRAQLARPMDASDTNSLYEARQQLRELRFALNCTSSPPAITWNENQDEVRNCSTVIPAVATVAHESQEETKNLSNGLQMLGVTARVLLQNVESAGEMFTDPDFEPTRDSLAHDWSILPSADTWNKFEWARLSDIAGKNMGSLVVDGISHTDIHQGSVGNCYFLSALAVLTENPDRIMNLFLPESRKVSRTGAYGIRLCVNGQWTEVIIDDYVPCTKGSDGKLRPAFAQPRHGSEFWVLLLEKAWAKVAGSYQNIDGGDPGTMLQILTGAPSTMVQVDDTGLVWDSIKHAAEQGNVTAASILDHPQDLQKEVGLVKRHCYAVLKIAQVKVNGINTKLIKLRNPWGSFEWRGAWSDKSSEWTHELREELEWTDKDDGVFFMQLADFVKVFSVVHINNVSDGWHFCSSESVQFANERRASLPQNLAPGSGLNSSFRSVLKLTSTGYGPASITVNQVNQRSLHAEGKNGYVTTRFWVVAVDESKPNGSSGKYANICATPRVNFYCASQDVVLAKGTYLVFVEGIGGTKNDCFVANCYSSVECSLEHIHSPMLDVWDQVQDTLLDAFSVWAHENGAVNTLAANGAPNVEFRSWQSPVHGVTCLLYDNKKHLFPVFKKLMTLRERITVGLYNVRVAVAKGINGGQVTVIESETSNDPTQRTQATIEVVVQPGQSVLIVMEQANPRLGFKADYHRTVALEDAS